MEKINTNYRRRTWKSFAKLLNMRDIDVAPSSCVQMSATMQEMIYLLQAPRPPLRTLEQLDRARGTGYN